MHFTLLRRAASLFVVLGLLSSAASAQWLNYPTPGVPRLPDGKPDLAAPAPKAPDGKPDRKISTTFDLIGGDIETKMDEAYATGNLQDLRAFHQEREKEGHTVVENNAKALMQLIDLFIKAAQAKPQIGDAPPAAQ